jgi:hypothetical protein
MKPMSLFKGRIIMERGKWDISPISEGLEHHPHDDGPAAITEAFSG